MARLQVQAPKHVKPRATPGARKLWFLLHSWVGLKLSLLLSFILITGTLAVLGHEIDWLLDSRMRATPQSVPAASMGQQIEAVQQALPRHHLLRLDAPRDPWFAARASVMDGDGTVGYAHVDPWSLEVQGPTSFANAHRFLRFAHRHLMLPVQIGVPIVCSLAVLLLISLVSSLYIYKRWWTGFFRLPRRGQPRRFWGDLHRLAGLWSIWFIALISLTSVYYLAEQLGAAAPPLERFEKQNLRSNALPAVPQRISAAFVEEALTEAARTHPDFRPLNLLLPVAGDDLLLIEGQWQAVLVRDRANLMAFRSSPDGGIELVGVRDGAGLGLHQRLGEAVDPLHFGTWGGFPVRLLWFVFGALLSLLALSGVHIYVLRLRAAQGSRRRQSSRTADFSDAGLRRQAGEGDCLAAAESVAQKSVDVHLASGGSWWHIWMSGQGRWRWLSMLLVAVCLALTPLTLFR